MKYSELRTEDEAAFQAYTRNPLSRPKLSETHRQHGLRTWMAALRYERERVAKAARMGGAEE